MDDPRPRLGPHRRRHRVNVDPAAARQERNDARLHTQIGERAGRDGWTSVLPLPLLLPWGNSEDLVQCVVRLARGHNEHVARTQHGKEGCSDSVRA